MKRIEEIGWATDKQQKLQIHISNLSINLQSLVIF